MTIEPFPARRAFLQLSDDDFEKLHAPIFKRCMAAWYIVIGVLSVAASVAFFLSTTPTLKHILQSVQIGLSAFVIVLYASIFLQCTRCIVNYAQGATFRAFCRMWHTIDGL